MKRVAVAVVVLLVSGASTGVLALTDDADGVGPVEELLGPTDAFDSDTDDDGLGDAIELNRASNPTVADTDGDGLDDGREASLGTGSVASDTDGDDLTDGDEVAVHGTDPVVADTDADGLTDREEVAVHGSDPTRTDGDSDGLDDPAEVRDHSTDPTKRDTDGDGLGDGPEVRSHSTDPVVADTDGDSVDDGTERRRGSSPTSADTDGDALLDGAEYDRKTEPTVADTDGDGFADGVEVHASAAMPNGDPARKDVYLEIDHMRGTKIPRKKLKRVQRAFATAPVENPDGSRGITLHIRASDSPVEPEAETTLSSYWNNYYNSAYDERGYGYFHALIVRDVSDQGIAGMRVGLTSRGMNGMLVEDRPSRARVAKTLMHELGHNLGLYADDHRGIDSYDLGPKQYPSVMNYHRLGRCNCHYDYSDGTHGANDFDDWGHIASVLAKQTPNASKAEAQL